MNSKLRTILLSGFLAGTLDLMGAFLVYSVIQHVATPQQILQHIASGALKQQAFAGGWTTAIYGLVFHFCIALAFAAFYFFLFPYLALLRKNKIVSGLVYGIFVWVVMNLIVLQIVFPNKQPMAPEAIAVSMGILMVMVGLPIAWITDRHYSGAR